VNDRLRAHECRNVDGTISVKRLLIRDVLDFVGMLVRGINGGVVVVNDPRLGRLIFGQGIHRRSKEGDQG
jgi:hypothetical protein